VLSELIDAAGQGFVTSFDAKSLLGLITPKNEEGLFKIIEQLRIHLKRYLKTPFQIIHSERMTEIAAMPAKVQQMRRNSASLVYEQYSSGGEKAIEVALQYIAAHFATELSLEKVASFVYLNPVYFSQLFKQKTGVGFKDFLTQLRLDRAMKLLRDSELKVGDISERVGYLDVRYFSQIFRKKTGFTPSEYRQSVDGPESDPPRNIS
jgi:two-component system response regulator YesN